MATYRYARVSTTDQDLTVQLEALKAAGCTIIRAEKVTGTTTAGRAELRPCGRIRLTETMEYRSWLPGINLASRLRI